MNLSPEHLAGLAISSGHQVEPLERVLRLIGLLRDLRAHPFLGPRLALKGGTALNLFIFDLPRLSVDIDLNYIGALDRDVTLTERPKLIAALEAVCSRQGLKVRVPRDKPEGFKWELRYTRSNGQPGKLELDVSLLLRAPLWPPAAASSHKLAGVGAEGIIVLERHELAAGKLAAAFSRRKSRDLFDLRALLGSESFDLDRLRFGFVVYGGMNRVDWRRIVVDDLDTTPADVDAQLSPMLRRDLAPSRASLASWTHGLISSCRALASRLLPLRDHETEFITRLNDHGEIRAELITSDVEMCARLLRHPMLLWKALNVSKHRGARR